MKHTSGWASFLNGCVEHKNTHKVLALTAAGMGWAFSAMAADNNRAIKGYVDIVEKGRSGMTVWQIIQAGGWVMVILCFLSLAMVALITYLFLTLRPQKLVPQDMAHDLLRHLRDRKFDTVRRLCIENRNLLSSAVLPGIDKLELGYQQAKESIEIGSKREISKIWQRVGFLSDIVTIAPLIGLLGTVLGMIQAFNTIAFDSGVVKPILLAGGVSKAMITNATGLTIAIVAMGFFSYFRARVQEITNLTEVFVNDTLNALSRTVPSERAFAGGADE